MKKLLEKYREIIIYLIVGVLTTIVSWGACFVAKFFLDSTNDFQNFIINTIGWVVGVCFAYPLNRKWVFRSTNKNIVKEFFGFAASRLSTWILDILIMWAFVNSWLGINVILPWFTGLCDGRIPAIEGRADTVHYWFVKIFISAVLVTILNYVFSKVLIFGNKKNKKESYKAQYIRAARTHRKTPLFIENQKKHWQKFSNFSKIELQPSSSTNWSKYAINS